LITTVRMSPNLNDDVIVSSDLRKITAGPDGSVEDTQLKDESPGNSSPLLDYSMFYRNPGSNRHIDYKKYVVQYNVERLAQQVKDSDTLGWHSHEPEDTEWDRTLWYNSDELMAYYRMYDRRRRWYSKMKDWFISLFKKGSK